MTAAILSIGTELTRGELTNTNASWLGDRLTQIGFEVTEHVTVADDLDAIGAALGRLAEAHQVVVSTGGLGPTSDDVTSLAVARAIGVSLRRHEPSFEALQKRYALSGRELSASLAKQAELPAGAEALPNSAGSAPGFIVVLQGAHCFFLPGVPPEMRRMFDDGVHPRVGPMVEKRTHQLRLRTFGLPESQVGDALEGIEDEHEGLTLGYRVSFPEIEVKILATGQSESDAAATVERAQQTVRERLGDAVYGEESDTYPSFVGQVLRDRSLTVSVAESCTGGLVGELLTEVPGSSDYFLLDTVVYSNAAKSQVLGVSAELLRGYGAVSSECAAAMADGVRRLADADLALAITGIAGPSGGSDEKPVGTVWMGIARRDRPTTTELHQIAGDRWRIRRRAAYLALRALTRVASSH